jgi:uncharacterized protein
METRRDEHNVAVALIVGATLIICTWLVVHAAGEIKGKSNRTVRVTGSARKLIKSDLVIWTGRVRCVAPQVAPAYAALKSSMDKTRAYLLSKGVPRKEILEAAIVTRTLYAPRQPKPGMPPPAEGYYDEAGGSSDEYRPVVAYELAQEVEVRSGNVELVDRLSRSATELIKSGVELESLPPKYLYTKLSDLKVSMLAEAAKDARARAEQIAANGGCKLGPVQFARMGVMRITPAYTTVELNEYGTNDTSSLDKEITAVVTVAYAVQ